MKKSKIVSVDAGIIFTMILTNVFLYEEQVTGNLTKRIL